jgi:pyruvate/2-oxoglutarate dehydrogenase complex dihydrolipoamide dehydrogenase (E3) component
MPEPLQVPPWDEYNQKLVQNVHPADWVNPEPPERYQLVVIGAGTAGLVTAAGAAVLGAKVALIERELMGGDCLNVGCVPSKALLASARAFAAVRDAHQFGVEVPPGTKVNFAAVMERMRRLRAQLSPNDSAHRFRSLGVDVFLGPARFAGPDRVVVGERTLHFSRAVLAMGARASKPDIPGIAEAGFLTNETVFGLTELPRRLAVIGAGPIGCELAQAFARFGSEVSLIGKHPQILPREDRDAAAIVEQAMIRDGVKRFLGCSVLRVDPQGTEKVIRLAVGHVSNVPGETGTLETCPTVELRVDEILVGVGRTPNVDGMMLEAAGVKYDSRNGVEVNDKLRTSNRRIYAAGDICSRFKFTHAADAMARIVIQNALFWARARVSALTIPWCTYTDPEIAHVGLYEHEAKERGLAVQTFVQSLEDVDRAVLDGTPEGLVKVHVRQGTDRIVGATIVAPHAGEMISEVTLALVGRLGLGTVARTIHPYPTQAEAIKKTADAYYRTRLTPLVKWLLGKWLAWMR